MFPNSAIANGSGGRDHASETNNQRHNRYPITPTKSKDDTCTQTRVRHPTDRGYCPEAAPLSPNLLTNGMHFFDSAIEARSRAYTAGSRPTPFRMNVYKRAETPAMRSTESNGEEKSTTSMYECSNGKHCDDANDSTTSDESPTKAPKRESWLQKSWRAAQSHCQTISKQYSSPINTPSSTDQQNEASNRKPTQTVSGGTNRPLSGFFERLRPRSNSDASASIQQPMVLASRRRKNGRGSGTSSTDESRKSSGFGDDEDGNGMSQLPVAGTLQKTGSSPCNTHNADDLTELDSWCEEEMFGRRSVSPTMSRKRSNSEATNYLIMRKTSRPNGAEVLGSLGSQDDAYKGLLTKFTCYELMPTQGAVVVIDCQLPTRQALTCLSENGVRAALLWDSRQRMPISLLTVTDLLRIMCAYFASPTRKLSPKSTNTHQSASEFADILRQPIVSNLIKVGSVKSSKGIKNCMFITVGSSDALHVAVMALRLNKIHRVVVVDPEAGNPLYLLSSKRLLHFLYNHMSSLPLPSTVYKSLDELRLGTWADTGPIVSVTLKTTVMEAAAKFLESGISGLPVLEACTGYDGSTVNGKCAVVEVDPNCTRKPHRLVDSLTKVDLLHFILVAGWTDLQERTVADVLKVRHPHMEKPTTCHRKTPLSLAIDRMILLNAHRIYIVDSSGVLEGLLSVGDLLSYLLS